MAKRIGISDVALAAGVSATTVSHALSGQGQMNPQTRLRVERIATELGYAPNRIASALRRQRSGIIGFVSDEIATTPFAGQLVLGAQHAAAARGFLLMVVNSNRDVLVERSQINALLAQQVDAIVYAKMFHNEVDVPGILHQVPTVLVDAYDRLAHFPAVVPDEEQIAESATELLIASGHRRIAHLTIEEDTPAKTGRLRGYRRSLERAGIAFDPSLVVTAHVERGAAATGIARVAFASFLESGKRPSGVFCFNDQFAMGVYQAAALFDIRIPHDLSVVGVDNLEIIAANITPGLTTVALPHYEMGRWAVETAAGLVSPVSGGETPVPPSPKRMSCYLVERESVAVHAPIVARPRRA
ncbi:MAG: LacI family DNA-binding transcriptional regulator [Burkholderiaceae bacterium]|nr:LacI family DNA-binding transcriptional regulator [Microbacteriaceae bacterium]